MASQENTARIRAMFGNFDIQETIGQGGMGVVYRARDITLGRDVAIKVLKDELRENPRVVARFRREAEAVASLDHPRIVQVYSVGAVGSIPYFAMEFIEGKPLNRILRRHKFLQWKPALQVARDVAEALDAAHEAGIIHRDIKPGNILIDRSANAYVSDFGIAKVLSAETQLTVDGSKLGTPQYMSPERVQSQAITIESDLYSLGVVLFQMLTGRLPYDAHDPVELIRMIAVDPPRRVREFKPELPEDIERLVAYMIEKKPQDRPKSARHVVELIDRLLDGQPLFDSDSGIDDALEGLREEMSTPHSDSTLDSGEKRESGWSRAKKGIAARWNGLAEWSRTLLVAVPLLAVAYLGGSAYSTIGGQDRAQDIVRAFSVEQSGWYQDGQLVRYYPVEHGVAVVQLLLDGHRFEDVGWAANATAFGKLFGGDRAGIVALNPRSEGASLLIPIGRWRPSDSLVLYSPDSGVGIIVRPDGNSESHLLVAHFDSTGGLMDALPIAQRVVSVVSHPEGNRFAVVRHEGRNGRIVEEWHLERGNPRAETLFTSQHRIAGLSYSFGGRHLVFQEESQVGVETNIIAAGEGRRRLTLGPVRLPEVSVNRDGDRLLALEEIGDETHGVIFDARTGARLTEFGEAADAAWATEESAAFLARDTSGTLQVWRLDNDAMRIQRTFIEGGVEPRIRIRPADGMAMVTAVRSASVVFVEPQP